MAKRPRIRRDVALILLLAFAIALAGRGWLDQLASRENGQPGLTGPVLLVAVLDVGQGDAIFVKAPSGKSMLIDAGDSADDVKRAVLPFLKQQGVSGLDYLVLTHSDQDHVGGMPTVLSSIRVETFVDPVLPDVTNNAYQRTLELVKEQRVKAVRARFGKTTIDLGPEVQVQVLAPADPLIDKGDSIDNNNSIVLRVLQGKVSFLLTGDIEPEAEERVLSNRSEIRSQILKVAHHGSRGTTTDEFLDAVKPEIALISAGKDNRYGHPHKEALDRLNKHGVEVYRTDLQGTILVRSDGERYTVETTKPAR